MNFFHLLFIVGFLFLISCHKNPAPMSLTDSKGDSSFAKGADISWVTQMESEGIHFYNKKGLQEGLITILKEQGMNAVRLRIWVNPPDGWCNTEDVISKALRAKALGMRLLLDFHYSDLWADPGQQTKPEAWEGLDASALDSAVYSYTVSVLQTLKLNGVSPQWVQLGNETNDGMLWPEGKASVNMAAFASMIDRGYGAVKSVFPEAKVVIHLSNGFDNSLYRWIFDGLTKWGARWDVIGMSLYPTPENWEKLSADCVANMRDMVDRYNKEVMVCETGMNVNDSMVCKQFLVHLIGQSRDISGGKCLGVFYWEPECFNGWNNYFSGAFNHSGQPTMSLDAFE